MQILLDNMPYNIGQPLPDNIKYCVIEFHPMELNMIQFPIQQKQNVIKWFETLKEKAEMLLLNNIIYQQKEKNEIQKFNDALC